MTWQLWIVFSLFVLAAATQPLTVRKPSKPKTGNQAAVAAIVQLACAALILWGAS